MAKLDYALGFQASADRPFELEGYYEDALNARPDDISMSIDRVRKVLDRI